MKNSILYISLFFGISALFTSCDDTVVIPNEEELITTLKYTLTPVSGGDAIEFIFTDLDGDGGNIPVITNGTLADSTTYVGVVSLLNEASTPTENITEEVEAEAEDHQFFYSSSAAGSTISYTDQDGNGNPLGIETSFETLAAGSGTLTITLRHEPNKTADGVSNGLIANAGGETDIEVVFNVTIQ